MCLPSLLARSRPHFGVMIYSLTVLVPLFWTPWIAFAQEEDVRLLREGQDEITRFVAALKANVANVAAWAPGALGPTAQAVVPALVAALKDDDVFVRRSAAYALWRVGPAAKDAIPSLTVSLKDRDAEVRGWAAKALR